MRLHHPHCRTKSQKFRFPPYAQATYGREGWRPDTAPRYRKFPGDRETAVARARAFISALQRRRAKGGAVRARLEFRDERGIWHVLPLSEGGAL